MKILAFITTSQGAVLDRILRCFDLDRSEIKATGPPAWVKAQQEREETGPLDEAYLADPIYEEPAWTAA